MTVRTGSGLSLPELTARWRDAVGAICATTEHRIEEGVLRNYADLFGYTSPRFHSARAARAEGYQGLVAPAGYAAVYTHEAVLVALHDPDLGVPFAWNLHAGQSLDLFEPVCAGDVLTTTVTLSEVVPRPPNLFYSFTTETRNGDGRLCASGISTQVVRFL
jgi:acyl dehydratase